MSPAWRERGIAFGLGNLAPGLGHLHARRPTRGFVWALRGRPRGIHWSSDPKSGRTRWDRIGRTVQPAPVH
jgi:hypothetical protein